MFDLYLPPSQRDRALLLLLVLLPPAVTWLFVPTLAEAFRAKAHVASLGASVVLCLALARRQLPWPVWPAAVAWSYLLLLASVILPNLFAVEPMTAWRGAVEYLPLALLLPVLAVAAAGTTLPAALQASWLVAAAGAALLALQQAFAPGWIDFGFVAPGKLAVFSTLGNPIWASIVFVAALPLAIHFARHGRPWRWGLVGLLALALWATESRQAWLAAATMAWLAVVWLGSPRLRLLAVLGLISLIAAALAAPLAGMNWLPHSLSGRWLIWQGVWRLILDHPLGVGFGLIGTTYPAYQAAVLASPGGSALAPHAAVIEDAHNEFLQWGASAGLPGLLAFSLFAGAVFWLAWRSPRVRAGNGHWLFAYASLLVTAAFTGIQHLAAPTLLLITCQGVLLAQITVSPRAEAPSAALHLGRVAVLLLAVAAFSWALVDWRAGALEGEADRLLKERDAWLAEEAYARALAIDDRRPGLLKKHASMLFLDHRYADALGELERARSLSGDTGIGLLQAEILAQAGRRDEAVQTYESIVAAFPALVTPRFVLGQLYYRQGRIDAARAALRLVADAPAPSYNATYSRDKLARQRAMACALLLTLESRESAATRLPARCPAGDRPKADGQR